MLVACWSAKGGSGATVVAAALGVLGARSSSDPTLLVDLGGDLPIVLGAPPPTGPGVLDWLAAEAEPDALDRLVVEVDDGLHLVPRGTASCTPGAERLVQALADRGRVIVDCGPPRSELGVGVAVAASTSLLVVRPCFLTLRRAAEAGIRPTGLVVVEEYGRVLGRRDMAESLGVAAVARVRWDPAVARAVDAGTLATRLPRSLARGLRSVRLS